MKFNFIIGLILFITIKTVSAQSPPNVIVSIKPIHSIVSMLMDGVASPNLLLDSNASAHIFHLKPSQVKLLSNADLVITISDSFEIGLRKALKNINKSSHLIISNLDNLKIYNLRGKEIYLTNEGYEDHNQFDLHLWLDVANIQLVAEHISSLLIELDSSNSSVYSNNLMKLSLILDKLNQDLQQKMSPFVSSRFAIYSDTLQYFEKSLKLQRPVMITPYHGAGLSIKRTLEAKRKIKDLNITCLIYDTEVKAKQLQVLSEGLNLKTFKIDVLGNKFIKGKDQYFNLMKEISNQLTLCLE